MKFITNWLARRAERRKARTPEAKYEAQIAEEERADRQTTHAMYLKVGIDTLSPNAWQQQAKWMLDVQEDVRQLKLRLAAVQKTVDVDRAALEAILNPPGSAVPRAPAEATAPAPKRRGRPPKAKPHA